MTSAYVALGLSMLLGFSSAWAGTIICGTHEIRDDQIPGQTRADIRHKCGTPHSTDGDNLYYKMGGRIHRLHFNDNDELESIELETE